MKCGGKYKKMDKTRDEELIKLTFIGDVLCKREILKLVLSGRRSFDEIFADVKQLFSESDYVIGNLETPIAGEKLGYTSIPSCFNSPESFAEALFNAGVNMVSTANNHCLDRGVKGLCETLDALDRIGLEHVGTYRTKEESDKIKVVDVRGVKFSFVAGTYGYGSDESRYGISERHLSKDDEWHIDLFRNPTAAGITGPSLPKLLLSFLKTKTPSKLKSILKFIHAGCRPTDYLSDNVSPSEIKLTENIPYINAFLSKLEKAKQVSDFVIALPHLGGQYNPYPGFFQEFVTQQILSMGIDLIVENHSHNPQPINIHENGTLVAYSLGNFAYTPYIDNFVYQTFAEYGVVLHVYVNRNTKRIVCHNVDLVKNILEQDGFARTVRTEYLLGHVKDEVKRERLYQETNAIKAKMSLSDKI